MPVFLARVQRRSVDGMPPSISLDLIRDDDPVELVDGDEFLTVTVPVDPFDVAPG